jgi:trk system potassium uptake protein
MSWKPVFYVNGILLLILSGAMLFPVIVDLATHSPDWRVFGAAQIVTAFAGFALVFTNRQKQFTIARKETFVLTALSYLFVAAFGALPFLLAGIRLGYAQAFFEAMSGITATGSTVIAGLDTLPKGILLWRAILQWLGGMGILIIALAILPLLQISGMQIFKSQSFGGGMEKVLPSAAQIAVYIVGIYMLLTAVCAAMLHAAGMSIFDAICHALATLSTGGFSTYDSSIAKFRSPLIEYTVMFFMILGSLPFVLYVKLVRGNFRALWHDSQVRVFFALIAAFSFAITVYLVLREGQFFSTALRNASFMVVTLVTTTGFANADYSLWGPFAVGMAFVLTFMGGCSGSTTGAFKTFRVQILWKMLQTQLHQLITPHGLFRVYYNGKIVEPGVQVAVTVFFFVYIISWFLIFVLLQFVGVDFHTAITGAATSISNVGPGLGEVIGPAGNYSSVPPSALWIMSVAMLLGRLEFMAILVMLLPRFWRE